MAKKGNSKKGVVGIYISPEQIAVAEVSLKGSGRFQPDHLIKFSTDFPKKGGAQRPMSQNADFFKNEAAWVAKFKSAVGKISWGASEAVVTLSEGFSILRFFSMPAVPRKFWSKTIPLESKKYIPISFDNAATDYDAVLTDGGKKINVLFGISQKDTVTFLGTLLKSVSLNLHSVEISAISMERFFTYIDAKEHLKHGYVHAADDSTHLLFSAGYRPVLHREFENENGMSERRRLDIKGAMQYVDRYSSGDGFNAIMLSGEYAPMLQDSVAREAAPIQVMLFDLEARCGTQDTSSAAIFAMGAALFDKVGQSNLHLDISGISNAIRVNTEIQKIVYSIGAVVIAILMLLTLKGQLQLNNLRNELNGLLAQNGESDLSGLNAEEINDKITSIKDQAMSLAYVFSRKDYVAPKLSILVDEIPKQLWIDQIKYQNPVKLKNEGGPGVNGKVMSYLGGTYLTGQALSQVTEGFVKELKTYNENKDFVAPKGKMELSVTVASKAKIAISSNSGNDGGVSTFRIECVEGEK